MDMIIAYCQNVKCCSRIKINNELLFFIFLSFLTLLKDQEFYLELKKQSSKYCEMVNKSREAEVKGKGKEER